MSFEKARAFFEACEAPAGWEGCSKFTAEGATFTAQAEPVADLTTVEAYCEWMKHFGTVTAPGATYELHGSAWDEDSRQAMFFATYHATHTGKGGPVTPTKQSTDSHYVYIITMNEAGLVQHMVKVWNAPWAMRELGWL